MRISERRTSFSSDDEVPLKYYDSKANVRSTAIRSLYDYSKQFCEFCDKVCNNRFKSFIHNATHIIIPLLNQKIFRCEECLFCFTSHAKLQDHVNSKHPSISINETDIVKPIKRADNKANRERLKNRIKFEDDDHSIPSELLDDLTTDCSVKLGITDLSFLNKNEEVKKSNCNISNIIDIDILDNEECKTFKNKYVFGKNCSSTALTQKDEGSEVNCVSKSNKFNMEFEGDSVDEKSVKVNGYAPVEEYFKSVHYDVLRKPKTVKCRHCKRRYPDRYDLLVHEATHIDFDRSLPYPCTVCDRYIAGDRLAIKRHMKSHPADAVKRETISNCLKCGLLYRRYPLHCTNYHANESGSSVNDLYDKIMEICELCFCFLKSRQKRHYVRMGSVSKLGKMYTCSACGRKFFELHRVRKIEAKHNWKMEKRQLKRLTNNQRLKKIQHRLKAINKMRKF